MNLGQRLSELRNRKHLTQDQVAEALGIKRARYNAWENGISSPDNSMLVELAKYHKVSVDYLLGYQPEVGFVSQVKEDSPSYNTLTPKEERDIAERLQTMMEELEGDASLAFMGEPMDDEDRELLRLSLENTLRMSKQLAKKKFTPKKYRK